ncbi:hypothetical protein HEK616_42590 [Streptomyces nigrescens]|uniref:Integral membrane protein n=2 Tax=Streptomyces TaxID=1883 RepID=A0ABN6QX36_STRNI|nr:hypothetical protein [Streptomyces nigrescens]MEE4422177.1 hypothetical protein [Streptomyces sp. DSM 41528]BDM70772.1 hypothetical protein HEK616_42590 [Streptomyces nigrescens]
MRKRDAGTALATAVAWGGAAAFLICLLVRKVAPYPRWDLLACLAVSAGAVLAWWLRASGRWLPAGGATPAPPRPGPTGRRRLRWWPARRLAYVVLALTAVPLPLVMLFLSTTAATPQLAAILAHHPRISEVAIAEVHHSYLKNSRNYRYYESAVTVTVSPADRPSRGTARLKGTVQTSQLPQLGDRFAGLYAADAPGAGVILDRRAELRALLGGPAGPGDLVMLALYSLFPLSAAAAALRPRAAPHASDGIFGDGEPRMLRVRIVGPGAGNLLRRPTAPGAAKQPGPLLSPSLRLASSHGPRDLFLDRCLDPVSFADTLQGAQGRLYWTPRTEDRPEWSTPALLVLDDGRYVRGTTPIGTPPETPMGEPVSDTHPDPEPTGPVGPYALWQPHVHTPGAICFGAAFLAVVLLVTGVGYDGGVLRTACLVVAAAGPVVGVLMIGPRRTRYLRRLTS